MNGNFVRSLGICLTVIVMAFCSCDSGNGPEPAKDLELTYPKGGETFTQGQTVTVTWKANANIVSVYFKLTTNGGATWTETMNTGSIPAGNGKWEWTVGTEDWPANPPYPSSSCKIKILDYESLGANYRDSTNAFTVN